ncbi:MAG: class I SAM-dependent methyltransferase [Clostridia bacterium]|nr:class I SAM-dependent methyltransferase [Clostridia bacterium]
MSKFEGVADTLFIPLNGRIQVSKRFPEYFYDEKAISLEASIPGTSLQEQTSEFNILCSAARYHNMDGMMQAFIDAHPDANIVILGCGLETAYDRMKRKQAKFYEMDLPEVIAGRRKTLGERENETLISGDLFDLAWTEDIDRNRPTMIVVSGVFQYFREEKILLFIHNLQGIFKDAELVFDAVNSTGIKYAEKYVKKTGNNSAMMYFYVDDCEVFAGKAGCKLIEWRPFFKDAQVMLKKKVGLYTRIAMWVTDKDARLKILHLKL